MTVYGLGRMVKDVGCRVYDLRVGASRLEFSPSDPNLKTYKLTRKPESLNLYNYKPRIVKPC